MKIAAGDTLRNTREAMGKRLLDVELDTGICMKTLSLMENGKNNPCLDTLNRYCTYLGLQLKISIEQPATGNDLPEA